MTWWIEDLIVTAAALTAASLLVRAMKKREGEGK
jgi:hypothetical protein